MSNSLFLVILPLVLGAAPASAPLPVYSLGVRRR